MQFLVRSKRSAFIGLLLLVFVFSTIGVAAQDDVTIEWWSIASNELSVEGHEAVVEAFEAANPNIHINLTLMPEGGFDDRMTTTLGAGTGAPDVAFFWNANWFPQAMDLTPYLEADPDLGPDDYFEGFWVTRSLWQDSIVGLPLGVGANFVMYNKDVFDEAGVDYPTDDWTTDDFIAIAAELTNEETRSWGGDRPRGAFRAIWNNMGSFLYSEDSMTVDGYLNSPESVAAYTWLWDLVNSGATPTPSDIEILGTEGTGPIDLFLAGRLAMATLNQGHMLIALEEGANFGIVPEPQVEGSTRYVNAWALTTSVWAGTEHPDEAYEFLSFLVGPEGQRIMMEQGNLFPSIPAVLAEYEHSEEEWAQAFFAVLEGKQVAEWKGSHACFGTVDRAARDVWDLIMLGDEVERDEIEGILNDYVQPAQDALDECRERLGS
jgi:multiple sugar transport system substrate-binding protein